jgi:hypothetical protein
LTGAVGITNGAGIDLSVSGNTLTFSNSGVLSFNGLTGAVQGVSSWNGQTGAVTFNNYVSSFNGLTGAVQGVSSANGLTGAVTFRGGRGITHSVSGNGISFSVNFLRGGQTYISNNVIASSDILLLQTASGVTMYTATVNDVITSNIQIPSNEYTDPTPPSYRFIQQNNGTFYDVDYDLVRSGLIATIDGGTYA